MDTRALQAFVTVCETRNYQKAADLLQYAPSSVFKHVQQLENELGSHLFIHENRTLNLTKEGEDFLPHAKAILAEYRAAFEKKAPKVVSLTVGGCELNIGYSLIDLFSSFSKCRPDVHINMITSPNAAVPDMVRNGQVDIGFYYGHNRQHRELETIPMFLEPAYMIAARSNPLAGRGGLRYEDLNGMEFVYPHDSCYFVRMLMQELERRQINLTRITYLGSMHLVVNETLKDHVLTLAPEHALQQFLEVYDQVPLDLDETPICAWENVLVGKRADLTAVRDLIEFACIWARRNPPLHDFDEKESVLS